MCSPCVHVCYVIIVVIVVPWNKWNKKQQNKKILFLQNMPTNPIISPIWFLWRHHFLFSTVQNGAKKISWTGCLPYFLRRISYVSDKKRLKQLLTSCQSSSSSLIIDVVDVTNPWWTAMVEADPKSASRTVSGHVYQLSSNCREHSHITQNVVPC